MIDPTNPRVIQDSMRAMAGYSQGLIPTLMRTVARMVGTVTNPRAQTPVFDRILSQIQPQVIRGLSQQSAIAAQNFVPQTRTVYDRDVVDPMTGARSTRTFEESDIQDLLATAQITQQDVDRDYRRREETVDVGPERLNVSQVDHVLRTILRGAEAMGISAERLAGIDWAGIDLNTILTGAVENGEFNLDLSRIPGLDQDITDAFRTVAEGIAASGIQPLIQNAPLNRGQRTQAIEEPQRRADDVPLNATLQRLSAWLQRFSPQASMQGQRDPRTTLLQGLSGFLGQGAGPTPGGLQNGMQPHHTGQIAGPQNNPQIQSSIANALQRAMQGAGNVAVRAGNFAFNRLPQFIQRPILGAATQAGVGGAAAAGMNAAGQAAAGAAAANAARVAVGLKLLSVGVGLAIGAVVGVVAGLKSLANAAWATTQRVTQYSGALQAAQAISEMREMTRNYQMGSIVGATGSKRIESNDAFAEAMMPLEASIAILGNAIGSFGTQFAADTVGFFNSTLLAPALEYLNTIVQFLPFIAADTKESIKNGTDKIVQAIKEPANKDGWIHPTGGPNMMAAMLAEMMPGFNMGEPEKPKPFQGAPGPAVPNVLDPNRPFNPNPFGAGPFGR